KRFVTISRRDAECVALTKPHATVVRLAKVGRVSQQCLEHRLKIARRAGDDLKHLGGSGLLCQRFAQLVEQASVLDGDDGLVGERHGQSNLLIRERPRGWAGEIKYANRNSLSQERASTHR